VSVATALQAFAVVFPAELPDKTMIASVVLVTKYRRPLAVWLGAAAAFTVHVTVAVTLGSFLGRLPKTPVELVVAGLFAVGAVVLFRESTKDQDINTDIDIDGSADPDPTGTEPAAVAGRVRTTPARVAATAFATVLLAEWGDLTQLATASLAARTNDPLGVGAGALVALWAVAAIAAVAGRALTRRVPTRLLHRVAAAVFAGLALWAVAGVVS
jgi:putative Ca2+/H+ antiporter (TMEM165/GDT1 family)